MKIKKNCTKSSRKNNLIGNFSKNNEQYEVLAIITMKKKTFYLIKDDDDQPSLAFSNNFDIIDDKVPNFWIYKKFKYKNVIKNKNYNFKIIIDTYIGPKELIDDKNFFFDVINDSLDAEYTLYNCLIKHGYDLHTPPQT